jgi:hypothetical protein
MAQQKPLIGVGTTVKVGSGTKCKGRVPAVVLRFTTKAVVARLVKSGTVLHIPYGQMPTKASAIVAQPA